MATFDKVTGAEDRMAVDDEYFIHISGPWNGPVRVVDIDETSFTLATRDGHLEAGFYRVQSCGARLSMQSHNPIVGNFGWTFGLADLFRLESVQAGSNVDVD